MTAVSRFGRPRDPAVDRRVLAAAIAVYGDNGWSGFSIDTVARRARVGKASIYLRWDNRAHLLTEALKSELSTVAAVDTGSVRGDLIHLARQVLVRYLGDAGRAALRIGLEAHLLPDIAGEHQRARRAQLVAGRAIVSRAIDRHELPPGTSATAILESVLGAALFHAVVVLPEPKTPSDEQIDSFVKKIVDFALSAAIK
jgi:AcrR family transcriptional regulator